MSRFVCCSPLGFSQRISSPDCRQHRYVYEINIYVLSDISIDLCSRSDARHTATTVSPKYNPAATAFDLATVEVSTVAGSDLVPMPQPPPPSPMSMSAAADTGVSTASAGVSDRPASAAAGSTVTAPSRVVISPQLPRLLLVEDEAVNQKIVVRMLRNHYDVDVLDNGLAVPISIHITPSRCTYCLPPTA